MRQIIIAFGFISLSAVTAISGGYRIPEQSAASVAMSAATIASVNSADASYYNPANMVWMSSEQIAEIGVTYIGLPKTAYADTRSIIGNGYYYNGESKSEQFFIPTIHYVGSQYDNWRFGASITTPAGLSKRWDSAYQKTFAEEFTLKTIELNPTVAYKINNKLALGFGLRAVHSEGVVKSNGTVATGVTASRDMSGNSIDYGYNLALTLHPANDTKLAATYRSKVDLTITGNAVLASNIGGSYNGGANVTVPIPAALNLAVAYMIRATTLEAVYEKTYWSAYKQLDFNYAGTFTSDPSSVLFGAFDAAKSKNWKDTNTYRLGIKHHFNDKLDLMAGFAIDKNPVPDSTLGFELPDSDAKVYSLGMIYKIGDKTSLGLAYLYDDKEKRALNNGTINGSFSGGSAHLARFSVITKF